MVKEIKVNIEIKPGEITFPPIPLFRYKKTISQETKEGNITRKKCLEMLEQMFMIRALEEMIAELKRGLYKALPDFDYTGPTHLSIGQEATSTGAISAIKLEDYITSSHRGHGDSMAKGYNVVKTLGLKELKNLIKKKRALFNWHWANYGFRR